MKVSFTPRPLYPVFIGYEAGWFPETICTLWSTEKPLLGTELRLSTLLSTELSRLLESLRTAEENSLKPQVQYPICHFRLQTGTSDMLLMRQDAWCGRALSEDTAQEIGKQQQCNSFSWMKFCFRIPIVLVITGTWRLEPRWYFSTRGQNYLEIIFLLFLISYKM
jgi:hypothetical protein